VGDDCRTRNGAHAVRVQYQHPYPYLGTFVTSLDAAPVVEAVRRLAARNVALTPGASDPAQGDARDGRAAEHRQFRCSGSQV
jgi:hypothetical protein